tara:strand:+ start:1443 stop:2585 length:1143 start_codon:yes stop_codon:yes gene_type:complete
MIAIDLVGTNLNTGTKTYNINFCKYLNSELLDEEIVVFISKKYYKQINFDLNKNSKIRFILKSNLLSITFFRLLWMQILLPIELKLLKVKTLFSPMNFAPFLLSFFKIKSVLFLHSNLPWVYYDLMPGNFIRKFITKKLMEISISLCEILIVPSNFARNEIAKVLNLNKEKITSVYLGLDEKYLDLNKNNNVDYYNFKEKYILSILSCVKYHNIINLLKAFKLVTKEINFKLRFVLVLQILDQNYFEEIKKYINDNFKNNEIEIFFNLETDKLINLYRKTSLYIFTSYCEVFGLTTIEAMSQGCVVAVSNTSALPEINSDAAEYFDPNNIEQIKNVIKKNILEDKKNNNLIKKSSKHFQKFSWKSNIAETLSIIYSVSKR